MSFEKIQIADLMQTSGVGFGTSGARGLVSAMTDKVCYSYTLAFLQYISQKNEIDVTGGSAPLCIAVAGDLRPSTPSIMNAVFTAIEDFGAQPVNCGFIPSPAVALYGIHETIPSVMVTGSHIPDDRNGIKFNLSTGEILKEDEAGIRRQSILIPNDMFDVTGNFSHRRTSPSVMGDAEELYVSRYLELFPKNALQGKRIGVYQHSGVGRDILVRILSGMGAEVSPLGRSEQFIPVDTEAIREEDIVLAAQWSKEHALDAIVSTDGDADRPLVSDEHGQWLRGDVAGVLCAQYLGIEHLATPVSCNSLVELCGDFAEVRRTRIGSPYVIAAMDAILGEGKERVAGYEANGGFLLASDLSLSDGALNALPTRDAVIVILSILLKSADSNITISQLVADLPPRFTYSDRIKNFPTEVSRQKINELSVCNGVGNYSAIDEMFGDKFGLVSNVDQTDGLRISFKNNEVVHLRPSGNAPELRCYTESDTEERARLINRQVLELLEQWR